MLEPGGPGGPLAPKIFDRSVNPIPAREDRLSPPITTGTPNVFHLLASMSCNRDFLAFVNTKKYTLSKGVQMPKKFPFQIKMSHLQISRFFSYSSFAVIR